MKDFLTSTTLTHRFTTVQIQKSAKMLSSRRSRIILIILVSFGLFGFKAFKRIRVIISDRSRSTSCLRNSKDIHHLLDAINEKSDVNSFFASTFNVKGEAVNDNLFGVSLASEAKCDLKIIHETAVIESNSFHIPYAGVDIKRIVDQIIYLSKIDPSNTRSKALMATLRGVGGGKSRMIEECRIRLGLLYPNWLPIAVTFNHNTGPNDSDFAWQHPDLIVAYAVCSRIISNIYSISIYTARNRTNTVLNSVKDEYGPDIDSLAKDLLVGTVSHVAGRVKKVKPSVDSLVLFIDEGARLIEDLRFPPGRPDAYAEIRKVILGQEVGKILKTSLVMTSLSISVLGKTDSDRNIDPIILASKLPVDHIVRNVWLPVIFQSDSLKKERRVPLTAGSAAASSILEWVAASVNSAPRLVELMGTALQKELISYGPLSNRSKAQFLKHSMAAVLSSYESLMHVRYPKVKFPMGKYLYALIHGKPVALDSITLGFIRTSTFTNSLTQFQEVSSPDIVPESALSLLADVKFFDSVPSYYEEQIKREVDHIWMELKKHVQSPAPVKGTVLEDVFARVLRMRILSAYLKEEGKGKTSLLELLAIDINAVMYTYGGKPYNAATTVATKGTKKDKAGKKKKGFRVEQNGVNRSLAEWTANTFESIGNDPANRRKFHLLNGLLSRTILVPDCLIIETVVSSRSGKSWKEDVKRIDQTLSIMKPWPNDDHCDLMLFNNRSSLVRRDEIVAVFEKKSKEEDSDNNEVWLGHFYKDNQDKVCIRRPYEQYFKFCAATSSITEDDLDGDNGFLRALKEGRFVYVYVTTHPGPNVYLTPEDLNGIAATNSSGILVLNRDVTRNILGITFDVYALARSVV